MPHKTTIRTNGQTLRVNASVSHWTTSALALVASGDDDIPSTTTTTITSDYDLFFPNTATTATITVSQADGTVLGTYANLQINPGVGTRVLAPTPDVYQMAKDLSFQASIPLAPTGALAETFNRNDNYANNIAPLSTGRLQLAAIKLPEGMTCTSATFTAGTTAGGTLTNQWFALFNSSRVLLAQTADDTSSAWAAFASKTLAFTTPYVTTYSGLYYLGINVTAGTVPSLHGCTPSSVVGDIAPDLHGYSTTGLTDTAPATAAAITVSAFQPYAYIS